MIAFVETNFVIEIAFGQEESQAAEQILKLAQRGKIRLVLSTFSLIEPYWKIKQNEVSRKALGADLFKQQNQITRCAGNGKEDYLLQETIKALIDFQKKEEDNFEMVIEKVASICEVVEVNKDMFTDSLNYKKVHELEPQDALIYSSLIYNLKAQPQDESKCFLNRNTKDFNKPGIKEELDKYNCRLISSFQSGLDYIESEI